MPLSASIFRRGGPKKELFDATAEDVQLVDESVELEDKLKDLAELLHTDKIGRELSAAIWNPDLRAAEVVMARRNCARDMGFSYKHRTYFQVEEAVFLLDQGDLLLFMLDGAAGGAQRLLSVQEAYDLMMSCGVSMERYMLYGRLKRSGYLVMRHPARWTLAPHEHPSQVWGGDSSAWSSSYLACSASMGQAGAMVSGHGVSAAAAAASGAAAMEVDGPLITTPAAIQAAAAGTPAGTSLPGTRGSAPCASHAYASQHPQQQQQQQQQDVTKDICGGGIGWSSRSWWPACAHALSHTGSTAQEAGDNQKESCMTQSEAAQDSMSSPQETITSTPIAVIPKLGDTLRQAFPLLHPFPSIDGSTPLLPSASYKQHLVYDVFKPSSFVSRNKGVYPVVQCHLAVCSGEPPALADMRAADAHASHACAGEDGKAAGVMWCSVDAGDVTWFGFRGVDLMKLI